MKDFFAIWINKIKNSGLGQKWCLLCRPADKNAEAVPMPVGRLMFGPFGVFADHFGGFLRLGAIYALLMFFVTLCCGFSAVCMLEKSFSPLYCSGDKSFMLFVCLLLKIWLVSTFAVVWYRMAFLNRVPGWKEMLAADRAGLKTFVCLISFLLLNAVPLLSFYLLVIRIPNPDWRVETAYFTIVASGFLVPFILMRFYALPAFILSECSLPSLPLLWRKTEKNMLKILLSVFLLFLLLVMVLVNYAAAMTRLISAGEVIPILISEYIYSFIFLILAALAVNHSAVQKELLFAAETNEKQ